MLKKAANLTQPSQPAPRERILAAARALFYARGFRAVSVDEIAAAADTNKMTLYRHFASKDELAAECLREVMAEGEARWRALAEAHPGDPLAQLQAWIIAVGQELARATERGCAAANAAVELPEKGHPVRAVIEAYKTRKRERILALCRAAGFLEPERLADNLFLLLEGARINVQSVGHHGPGSRFVEMAQGLIAGQPRR